jgi:hypothetical protein
VGFLVAHFAIANAKLLPRSRLLASNWSRVVLNWLNQSLAPIGTDIVVSFGLRVRRRQPFGYAAEQPTTGKVRFARYSRLICYRCTLNATLADYSHLALVF